MSATEASLALALTEEEAVAAIVAQASFWKEGASSLSEFREFVAKTLESQRTRAPREDAVDVDETAPLAPFVATPEPEITIANIAKAAGVKASILFKALRRYPSITLNQRLDLDMIGTVLAESVLPESEETLAQLLAVHELLAEGMTPWSALKDPLRRHTLQELLEIFRECDGHRAKIARRVEEGVLAKLAGADEAHDGSDPLDAAHMPHTLAGFQGAMVGVHGRMPTDREVWDAAIRAYQDIHRASVLPGPHGEKPFAAPGRWFPTTIVGDLPMREFSPGHWETASWPSDSAPD